MTTEPRNRTCERLAQALETCDAPTFMVEAARAGAYDDFLSESPTPQMDLYKQARKHGLASIAEGVMRGEWDATTEEADAWESSPEGRAAMLEWLRRPSPGRER